MSENVPSDVCPGKSDQPAQPHSLIRIFTDKFWIAKVAKFLYVHNEDCLFVCVEVLRPSQPNGVMSSVVSLPNHTFTGQAVL